MRLNWLSWFVVLAILSAICIASPTAVIYGMLFIVPGLPLLAAPPALFYLSVAGLSAITVPRFPVAAALAGITVAAVMPPWLANRPLSQAAASLQADDLNASLQPASFRTVAMLIPQVAMKDNFASSSCHQYCQRLLFGGEAERVLVEAPPNVGSIPPDLRMASYRIETRRVCPPASISTPDSWFAVGDENLGQADLLGTRVMAAIARGKCIIRSSGRLKEADLIIVDRPLVTSTSVDEPRSLLTATRAEMFAVNSKGRRSIFRRTQVNTRPLMLPWIWTRIFTYGFDSKLGPMRVAKVVGEYALSDIMRRKLGFKLALPSDALPTGVPDRVLILQGLSDPYALTDDPRLTLIDRYLRQISERGPSDDGDLDAVARIVSDERADAEKLFHLSAAMRKLGPSAETLAGPLFTRLERTEMPIGYDEVIGMARGIQALPRDAIVEHMPRLRRLANDTARRDRAWPALTRLSEGGAAALPVIAGLLHDASGQRQGGAANGGLIALCRLALTGRSLGQLVEERIRRMPTPGGAELEWITLERQGRAADFKSGLRVDDNDSRLIESWRSAAGRVDACDKVWV